MSQFQDQIDSFAKSAERFVSWCDTPHGHELAAAFKRNALKELSTIYVAGFSIPDVEFVDSPEFPHVDNKARKAIAINLQSLPFQYYWVVFNPSDLEGDHSPNCGDLFDDFQDIYADLHNGLATYNEGYADAAAFYWRQMFVHWGRHAVEAMYALQTHQDEG